MYSRRALAAGGALSRSSSFGSIMLARAWQVGAAAVLREKRRRVLALIGWFGAEENRRAAPIALWR